MQISPLFAPSDFGLCIKPDSAKQAQQASLHHYLNEQHDSLEQQLNQHGAILFRGFDINTISKFEQFVQAWHPETKRYIGGDSPRTSLSASVYTSTEYPAEHTISLHNELSYTHSWPRYVVFYCLRPAATQGETPIADGRAILNSLQDGPIDCLLEHGVKYIQNLHDGWGLGRSWQDTFETDQRQVIEAFCRDNRMQYRWEDNRLYTEAICPATITHPDTGESAWFNQAELWHYSTWAGKRQDALLKLYGESGLPKNALCGDGRIIDQTTLDAIRAAYSEHAHCFSWKTYDVLLLDNLLCLHGRKPYTGDRKVCVAMA